MAYSSTNPPQMVRQAIAGTRAWAYRSSDATGTVDAAGYFTNGWDLGMRQHDLVEVTDTVNELISMHRVAAATAGTTTVDLGTGISIGSSANAD